MENSKKLTREEMKKITGGSNSTTWDCYWDVAEQYYAGTECSETNPAVTCDLGACVNTGVHCGTPLYCI